MDDINSSNTVRIKFIISRSRTKAYTEGPRYMSSLFCFLISNFLQDIPVLYFVDMLNLQIIAPYREIHHYWQLFFNV